LNQKLPDWFKQIIPRAGETKYVEQLLAELRLHTVCQGAHCPNIGQCFSSGIATFMIMGDICMRNCTFCAVHKGVPLPLNSNEPQNIAEAVKQLKLNYVVITCVTRDDLPGGGAEHFATTIRQLHATVPGIRIEVLVSDFNGNEQSIEIVAEALPEVFAHNLETVPRLYPFVRPMANYQRSLGVLKKAKCLNSSMVTKSGLMLGLGETHAELINVMRDLRQAGCELLSLGQYLAPSQAHHPVIDFITPEKFAEYEEIGLAQGFKGIAAAPLARSSFRAAELFNRAINPQENNYSR